MTETTTEPARPQRPDDLAALREEAKSLGIEPAGLSRQGLAASIAAVRDALAKVAALTPAPVDREGGEGTDHTGGEGGGDDRLTDEMGEDLGPGNIRRVPMGTRQLRLAGEQRPGFYRRWLNDVPGRIERARRAGYTHVKDANGRPISTPAGTGDQGGGMRAYLMELPDALRAEDLAEKDRVNAEIEAAVNRGKVDDHPEDKRYVPDQGIKINRPSRRA